MRAIQLFVRVAALGSFTRVAEEVGASKSVVSKEIARLEDDIGVRLLHRSTRRLQLTPAGEGYLRHCQEVLIKLADADAYVQGFQGVPKGRLRINAPMALGITDLGPVFAGFMRDYPDVELDIHLGDEPVDLIEQGFDLGFRASSRPVDSGYVGRPLARFRYRVCAAPSYLDAHGPICTPADLGTHNCFVYSYFLGRNRWPLDEGVEIHGTLRANNTIFMLDAVRAGLGIGFFPNFVCRDLLARGDVVEILPGAARPDLTLYALYPARHYLPPALTACVGYLQDWFSRHEL